MQYLLKEKQDKSETFGPLWDTLFFYIAFNETLTLVCGCVLLMMQIVFIGLFFSSSDNFSLNTKLDTSAIILLLIYYFSKINATFHKYHTLR